MKKSILLCAGCAILTSASGQIIFDDFNADEGHFTSTPTSASSSTTVGVASGTADRVTSDSPFEGIGHERIDFQWNETTTALRIRFLSGSGSPGSNTEFFTSAATDGFIGYYLKTDVQGLETSINLDGPGNTTAQMRGSPSVPIIGDGQWHLYEFDLDGSIWGTIPGIVSHTTGTLPDGAHYIDSIYFRDVNNVPSPSGTIFMDFVAANPNGSVGLLVVPEPSTYATAFGLILAGFAGYRRFTRKN